MAEPGALVPIVPRDHVREWFSSGRSRVGPSHGVDKSTLKLLDAYVGQTRDALGSTCNA